MIIALRLVGIDENIRILVLSDEISLGRICADVVDFGTVGASAARLGLGVPRFALPGTYGLFRRGRSADIGYTGLIMDDLALLRHGFGHGARKESLWAVLQAASGCSLGSIQVR